jgi:sugar (pentulose or hexulose) kinase
MDMRRLGLFTGGLLFPTPVSFHEKSRGHLIRASLEAGAYTIRANLEQTETLSGEKATTIAIGGGMSKSTVFVSILANVLGRNVSLSKESATSAFGAYLCTSTTQGHFTSLCNAIASARDRLDLIEFQNNTSQEYDMLYKKWLETVVKLKGIDL